MMKTKILLLLFAIGVTFNNYAQNAGNALRFNGTNSYCSSSLPTVFNNIGTNDFTIECWVNPANSSATKRVFFAQKDSSNFCSILLNTINVPYFFVYKNGIRYSVNTQTQLPASGWSHISFSWDARNNSISSYINGKLVAGISGGSSSLGNLNRMTIGARSDGQQPFNGSIDEFRIWNDIRTPCEILAGMNSSFSAAQPNLIAAYNFNQGVAGAVNTGVTTLIELNNNYNATLNGFTLSGSTANWVASLAKISFLNNNSTTYYAYDIVEACESYTWIDGNTYTSNNNTAFFTYSSTGGCDSTILLDLTINNSATGTAVITACNSYIWVDGNTYTASNNTATFTFANSASNGCDSVVTLDLTIIPLTGGRTTVSACDSYMWNSNIYTASGLYLNSVACNVDTLDLTITPTTGSKISVTACNSYLWTLNGQTYTASGIYTDSNNCHIDTLVLTITPLGGSTTSETACGSFMWSLNNQTYTTSGTYIESMGCQSDTLVLTITPISGSKLTTTACDNYTWSADGATYTSSGIYYFTDGCNSDTLVLTINQSTSNTTTIVAADSYTWSVNGTTYTQSGVYADTTANQAGCQHVETLNLTITTSSPCGPVTVTVTSPGLNNAWKSYGANNPNVFYYGIPNSQRINAAVSGGVGPFTYNWSNSGGTNFLLPRTYYPANSIDILEPTAATTITVLVTDQGTGCQYTGSMFMDWTDEFFCYKVGFTWYIKVCLNGQTVCVPWTIGRDYLRNNTATLGECTLNKVNNISFEEPIMDVYPNPSHGLFSVVVTNGSDGTLEIFDLSGKRISIENEKSNLGVIERMYNLSLLPQGMYFVQYTAGEIVLTKKFVIQD